MEVEGVGLGPDQTLIAYKQAVCLNSVNLIFIQKKNPNKDGEIIFQQSKTTEAKAFYGAENIKSSQEVYQLYKYNNI